MAKDLRVCISDIEINDYLSGGLSGSEKEAVEGHLVNCKLCLEKTVFAYKTVEEYNKNKKGAGYMKTDWTKNMWLAGAIIAFGLSFFVPRYFVQLLVATILMGLKWIFDSVNARILIMIYDAWKHGGEKEAGKILKTFSDRMH